MIVNINPSFHHDYHISLAVISSFLSVFLVLPLGSCFVCLLSDMVALKYGQQQVVCAVKFATTGRELCVMTHEAKFVTRDGKFTTRDEKFMTRDAKFMTGEANFAS